ncbi:MAG: hypothetical protein KBT47_05400, partial [Armatimonadetes bacterium]|nr:hypothetical protein [Candidatus Hippobium faecium]
NKDRNTEIFVKFRENPDAPVAFYDMVTGKMYKAPEKGENGYYVSLAGAGSLLIVRGEEAREAKEECPPCLCSGAVVLRFDKPVASVGDFECSLREKNLYVINDVTLKIGGKTDKGCVYHVCARNFASAPEGEPFEAVYEFESKTEIKDAFMGLETAENMDEVIFNGEKLSVPKERGELGVLKDDKAWLDPYITKVKLPLIKKGVNKLVCKGKKKTYINSFPIDYGKMGEFCPTDCEDVYILGDFSLERAGEGRFVISEPKPMEGRNITEEGAPFYIGKAEIKGKMTVQKKEDKKYWVKAVNAKKSSLRLFVNGIDCGVSVLENDLFDVTEALKDGENVFEWVLATTLYNAFGPNKAYNGRGNSIDGSLFVLPNFYEDKYNFEDYGIEAMCLYEL